MKKDLAETLNIFDKNKTIGEILSVLGEEIEITTDWKEPELVDLGLPSGNLWMKCNLGAKSSTDYGNYYQWGSLVGYQEKEAEKHSFWKTCPFNNGKGYFDKEYFLKNRSNWLDKEDIFKPEFDVVTQTYGPSFKIPTKDDFQELLDNTTTKLVRNYKGTKRNGRLFTSKINGNTMFIPFSGYVLYGRFYEVGNYCSLWSSRLDSNYHGWAYYLSCDYGNINLNNYGHACGFTLRGIKVKGN